MAEGSQSPLLRRSPRFPRIGHPLPATNTSNEDIFAQRRTLQFESEDHVAVQRSADAGPESSSPKNTISALTAPPDFQAGYFGEGAVVIDDEIEHRSAQVRISTASDMSWLFAFLSQLPVKRLRVILKSWDWRQSGKKESLVAKAVLHLQLSLLSGKTLDETLSAHEETRRYDSWLRIRLLKDENYPLSIDRVPTEEKLVQMLSPVEANDYREKIFL